MATVFVFPDSRETRPSNPAQNRAIPQDREECILKIRATQAIMECLLEQEVDTIFGYPGGTILNLYDELYRYQDKITHVLTAHEQGASHAADGYARSTGKVGVCFATSGPGATNLTTGIATIQGQPDIKALKKAIEELGFEVSEDGE